MPELPPWLQRTRARGHGAGLALWSGFDRADPTFAVTQAIGFERLVRLLDEVFGVRISEGAIANLLARAGHR